MAKKRGAREGYKQVLKEEIALRSAMLKSIETMLQLKADQIQFADPNDPEKPPIDLMEVHKARMKEMDRMLDELNDSDLKE
jgi:arginase family enzyme